MRTPLTPYTLPELRPPARRNSRGEYLLPGPDGKERAWVRATTLAGALSDEALITQYEKREVVEGLAIRPELLTSVDLNRDPSEIKTELNRLADAAQDAAGTHIARERGTQLHYFTEAVDIGFCGIDAIPAEYQREVSAYRTALDAAGITTLDGYVETILTNEKVSAAGTADRAAVEWDGDRFVLDVKTGKDLKYSWLDISIQLAVYANAELMFVGSGLTGAAPSVNLDRAIVAHIPVDKGTCDLYAIDIAQGWKYAQLARSVLDARTNKSLVEPFQLYAKARRAAKTLAAGPPLPEGSPFAPPPDPGPFGDVPNAPPVGELADPPSEHGEHVHMPPQPIAEPERDESGHVMTPLQYPEPTAPSTDLDDELAKVVAEAKTARKARRRRTKDQIRADEAVSLLDDGQRTDDLVRKAIAGLREAYGIKADTTAEPDPDQKVVADAEQIAAEQTAADTDTAGETGQGVPLADATPTYRAADGVSYTTQRDQADPAYVAAVDAVHAGVASRDAMDTLAASLADVWDPYLQQLAMSRVEVTEATIRDALDNCQTAGDMMTVFKNFEAEWSTSLTEYANTVLATQEKDQS